ncbi:MAG: SLC13 family permease [Methylococcales bacterium]|nr:SLC13 family permease [Methylococcales bacterium]
MNVDISIVSALLVITLAFLASNRYSADIILVSALSFLLVSGILLPSEALVGFSNPGMFTIAVLYIVVAGLRETGTVAWLSRLLLGKPRSQSMALIRLLIPAATMSAVINNSPVVAMFITAVQIWCKRSGFKASRFLLPLSYISILGGTCSLIGTSTNLVIDGLMRQSGFPGFSLFELSAVGIPITLVGGLYLLTVGQKILPDNPGTIEQFQNTREYLLEMYVEDGCELAGQSIADAGLRNLSSLYLVEIIRGEQLFPVISPHTMIEVDDHLVFAGAVESVVELRRIRGLTVATKQLFKLDGQQHERRLFEAVVSAESPIVNINIREARFRHRYNAVVLSVSRNGQRIKGKVGNICLQAGDTLLIEAEKGFLFKYRNNRDFLLISKLENSAHVRHTHALRAIIILFLMLTLTVTGLMSILQSALLATGAMLLTGCLTLENAQKDINYSVLIVIACAFGVGAAVQKVGLASLLASQALHLADNNPWILLILIYLVTSILTEMITNNAAAIIMFPIAMSGAETLAVNETPFAVAVMIAASASFLTPIGYQTNLMVYGPGGYQFSDYIKLGLPLSLITAITALWLIPQLWAF